MAYIDPTTVLAPRKLIRRVEVVFNSAPGEGGWSLARLDWEGQTRLGIRWNGDADSAIGNPQSHGLPTWFVIPGELEPLLLEWAEEQTYSRPGGLLDRYREMARDTERENEAQQWSEVLLCGASAQKSTPEN
jgi:hypothetical protein